LAQKSKLNHKRKDPENNSKFHSICEKCHQAYLERHILTPYWKTLGKLRKLVKKRETEYGELVDKVSRLESGITNCKRQVSKPKNNIYLKIQVKINASEEKCALLESNKQKLNRDLAKLTEAVKKLSQEEANLNDKISQNEEESKSLWKKHKEK
jgi:chromosome segregation ATPase